MPALRGLLLGVTLVLSTLASEEQRRIDLLIAGDPASQTLAIISEFFERDMRLADDLINAGQSDQAVYLHLHQADLTQSLQALAFSLGCWWAATADGIIFTRSSALPPVSLSRVDTYSSRLQNHHNLETLMAGFMAPWLGADHGLAYYAPLGRWTATFDQRGHKRFLEIMSAIERPQPSIPVLINPLRKTDLTAPISDDSTANSWAELVRTLAGLGIAVSINGPKPMTKPITIHAGNYDTLTLQLAAQNHQAEWVNDVLCIGGSVTTTEHPGQRARLAIIPVQNLGNETTTAALITNWCRPENDPWWSEPGAAFLHLPEAQMLIVQVDRSALIRLLADIDRFERREVLP